MHACRVEGGTEAAPPVLLSCCWERGRLSQIATAGDVVIMHSPHDTRRWHAQVDKAQAEAEQLSGQVAQMEAEGKAAAEKAQALGRMIAEVRACLLYGGERMTGLLSPLSI